MSVIFWSKYQLTDVVCGLPMGAELFMPCLVFSVWTASSVCKKMAMQAKQNVRMGSALHWAIRSKV